MKKRAKKIKCSICKKFYHKKCSSVSNKTYNDFIKNDFDYYCNKCITENIPFSSLSDVNFNRLNTDSLGNTLFSENVTVPKTQKFLDDCNQLKFPLDSDERNFNIQSQYLTIDEFSTLDTIKGSSFALGHLNIASLFKHIEDLQCFLSQLKHPFDIFGITEHKIKKNSQNSFNIPGYNFCFDVTHSSHGGTGFYLIQVLL